MRENPREFTLGSSSSSKKKGEKNINTNVM